MENKIKKTPEKISSKDTGASKPISANAKVPKKKTGSIAKIYGKGGGKGG